MKHLKQSVLLALSVLTLAACSKDDSNAVSNTVTLQFNNTYKDQTIVLGDAQSTAATVLTSQAGQTHRFSEIKYVVSNIRLVREDGTETPYNINNLDNGATVIDHSKPESLRYALRDIPSNRYQKIKFGLGVKSELNTIDQVRFPNFYAAAGANDTEMMWEWGAGYRFTKLEGFYGADNKEMSIHTGSTVQGPEGNYTQGVDAYRDITLTFPTTLNVASGSPTIFIRADFDKLLSGNANTITLSTGTGGTDNATPNIHTALEMVRFVDNLGGNGEADNSGMFSIQSIVE
ncbi:MbnP family protein [Sphingobacterium corticibacter]|uniref:Copper-binding protein MbnP-like domain-containing protein n=1 Tax=Sphingobacterium corticibacter TaxID=2171749 RepID=A0A2T8HMR7_9SPHI|nr:MbnP family protein [Sphingobacterium corticibacter]PVH26705.1 hypothetical protein DC487_03595 [Sphingobacterium corticibacter]